MRHPHDAGTQADSRRVRSAGQSWEVRSTEQATHLSGTASAPSARTKQALEYTFSGGYANNPDNRPGGPIKRLDGATGATDRGYQLPGRSMHRGREDPALNRGGSASRRMSVRLNRGGSAGRYQLR